MQPLLPKIQSRKKPTSSLSGQLIELSPHSKTRTGTELEPALKMMLQLYINKGWCISHRPGHIGLTGYMAEVKEYIPREKRKEGTPYRDFRSKDGTKKTRVYKPREERIVSLTLIELIDTEGNVISEKWELNTHWTTQRNLFDNFETAWQLFCEIEARYHPSRITWTKLDDYQEQY